MLFYRQNHNEAICIQMIDSLNVPVSSTFSYFCAKHGVFKDPGNFRNPTDLSQGLPTTFLTLNAVEKPTHYIDISKTLTPNHFKLLHNILVTLCFYGAYFGVIRMRILHFIETYMKNYISENSRAPPMRHHGFKIARRVYDTCKICNCFTLSQ